MKSRRKQKYEGTEKAAKSFKSIPRGERAERTNPIVRREYILNAALHLAEELGYCGFTRDAVAYVADISSSLIAKEDYFPRMEDLRNAVLGAAIARERLNIIAQGIIAKDPMCKNLSPDLKAKVMDYLSSK